jgi:hypothetical protein
VTHPVRISHHTHVAHQKSAPLFNAESGAPS